MSEREDPGHMPVLQTVESEVSDLQEVEQERDRRQRLFRSIALISALGTLPVLILFAVMWIQNPEFPSWYLVPVVVGFIVADLFAFWLSRRSSGDGPVVIYMVSLVIAVLASMQSTGGHTGPLIPTLVIIPVLVGLLAGRRAVRWITILIVVIYGVRVVLSRTGILVPTTMSEAIQQWLYIVIFIIVLVAVAFIVATFNRLFQSALDTARRRGQELAEASRQAQLAAEAERSARQREERAAQQLRLAVQQFAAFLERVSSGDYGARLDLDAFDPNEPGMRNLHALGRDLNTTVDTLVGTLTNMQTVQRRYTSEAWGEFAQSGDLASGFEYRQGLVSPLERTPGSEVSGLGHASPTTGAAGWLPAMEQAVQDQQLAVQGDELALPILLNGVLIGVLGARRANAADDQGALQQGQAGWSEEELTVIRLAVDQLAQTIENLRLLDVTRRNAARERTIGHVTGQIRQELDLERLLQIAVDQIQDAMNLDKVSVRLMPGGEPDAVGQASTPVDRQGSGSVI